MVEYIYRLYLVYYEQPEYQLLLYQMKDLLIDLLSGDQKKKQPKYQLLAEGIRQSIRTGQIVPSEILPSSRDLARRFGMNRHTVMRALAELISEGWIVGVEKQCYQVMPHLPTDFLKPKRQIVKTGFFARKYLTFARTVNSDSYPSGTSNAKYSFPSGTPDLRLFPMAEFKSHLYDSLKDKNNLGYGSPAGHPDLLEQIKLYLRRVRRIDNREIVVTNGSQEAIFYLAQLLINPSDLVAVESLSYPPAMNALRFAGARLISVGVDQEGLRVEELRKVVKKSKVRLLYITPLHQYPTTVRLSAIRRLELYEVCYENDILILEDDYDHEFHYTSQPFAPLASNDPAGIVLYVSTFSKILFPAARVGFMAVPRELAKEVSKLKRISSRQNEQLLQDSIARWMKSGGFERHLRKMRRTYETRRTGILEDLEIARGDPELSQINWIAPDGGMALWLNLNQNSFLVAEAAMKAQIQVQPEVIYQTNSSVGTHLRLGFSGQSPLENKTAIRNLFEFLKKFNRTKL